eukprot:1807796-Rhodomonas_salina.1
MAFEKRSRGCTTTVTPVMTDPMPTQTSELGWPRKGPLGQVRGGDRLGLGGRGRKCTSPLDDGNFHVVTCMLFQF